MVDSLPDDGTMCIEMGYWHIMKSNAQRRQAHVWLKIIADHTGHDMGELKLQLKLSMGHYIEREKDGQTQLIMKSSEDFTKEDYTRFIDAISVLANSLGVVLPQTIGD